MKRDRFVRARRHTRFDALRIVIVMVPSGLACAAGAQTPREITLSSAYRQLAETFTDIVALRELANGTVLVAEGARNLRLVAADFDTQNVSQIGRVGSGPGEYRGIQTLIALGKDSTLLVDGHSRRWIILEGTRPIHTVSVTSVGVGRYLLGSDSLGRVLEVRSYRYRPGRGPSRDNADSLIVLLHRRGQSPGERLISQTDTAALLRGSAGDQTRATREAVPGSPLVWVLNSPFAAEEQAILFPDGWIAVVRLNPYRVQWIEPSGTIGSAARLPEGSVEIDGRQVRAAIARKWARVRPPFRPDELPAPPKYLPAIGLNSLTTMPDGRLLVQRLFDATRPATLYDIIDRRGLLTARLRMKPNERVAGFGARFVYIVSRDEDNVDHLRRHAWQ